MEPLLKQLQRIYGVITNDVSDYINLPVRTANSIRMHLRKSGKVWTEIIWLRIWTIGGLL